MNLATDMGCHSGRATPSLHDTPYRNNEETIGRQSTYLLPITVQTNRTTSLYGSRARGDAGPDSDWDVLVMLHDNADWLEARAKMRRLIGKIAEDTNERVSILPLRWTDANEHAGLLANVAREGRPL